MNNIIYPSKGVISMSIFRESIMPRACLIQGAREIVDSGKLYVINKTGGSNSNNDLISSYLPNKSEILDNNSNLTAYHRTDNQKNTAAEVKSTAEGTAQSQRMQSANSGYMLSGKGNEKNAANVKNRWVFDSTLGDGSNRGKPNDGYPDYSFASRWTEMQSKIKPTIAGIPLSMSTVEQQTEMSRQFGNSRTNGDEQSIYGATLQVPGGKNPMELNDNGFLEQVSGNSSLHSSQYRIKKNLIDSNAEYDTESSGMSYGGVGRPWNEYVAQNTTGGGFTLNSVGDGLVVKPHLHDFWDNIKLIEDASEKYRDEIAVAVEIAEDIVPDIVLEIAEKAVVFLPPQLQVGARGMLIAINIGLAVYEVYDQWDTEVCAYEQKHSCSREVAEENVELAKKVYDAFMIFSTNEWLKYVMRSAGHPADFEVTVGLEALEMISEEKFKEWVRMITE